VATPQGQRVYPAVGGTNFQAPSYDQKTGVFYLAFQDAEGFANYGESIYEPGKLFYARGSAPRPAPLREAIQGIRALNADTGEAIWTFPLTRGSLSAGLLATRGGAVFAATSEGWFLALDAKTGAPLWRYNTGGNMSASPMTYSVDGKQYIAVSAGNEVHAFALPD
jgi:outer membrane protein assembly factor BamB